MRSVPTHPAVRPTDPVPSTPRRLALQRTAVRQVLRALTAGLLLAATALAIQSPASAGDRAAAGTIFGGGSDPYAGQRFGGSSGYGQHGGGGAVYVVPARPSALFGAPIWSEPRYDGYVVVPQDTGSRQWGNRRHRSDRNAGRAYRQGYQDGRRDARRERRRGW